MKFSVRRDRAVEHTVVDADSKSSIEYAVDTLMDHMLKNGYAYSHTDPSRANWLRISSLPFCAREWWLNQVHSRAPLRKEESTTLFFTRVGTAVHEAFQDAFTELAGLPNLLLHGNTHHDPSEVKKILLPHNAVLVQDWRCTRCKLVHEFQPKPLRCSHCEGTEFGYKEHQVRYSRKVLGHMDGCFAFPHKPGAPYSKKWIHIPIDYKTASEAVLTSGKLPYRGNAAQLLTYAAIKRTEGYNVPGVVLIYIRRDNPFKRVVCWIPLNHDAQLAKIHKWERHYIRASKAHTFEEAMALPRFRNPDYDVDCSYCEFKRICQAEDEGNLKPLKTQVQVVLNFLRKPKPHEFPGRP